MALYAHMAMLSQSCHGSRHLDAALFRSGKRNVVSAFKMFSFNSVATVKHTNVTKDGCVDAHACTGMFPFADSKFHRLSSCITGITSDKGDSEPC